MKKLTVLLAGLGIATAALPGIASAAPFGPANDRQSAIELRIDQGLRSGALNRNEAYRLKSQLREIVQLQYRYARDGRIDRREAADLDRRFDSLSAKVKFQKNDRDYGRGQGRDRDHRW
ncbi:MAG: hypothetical protein V4459_14335 [Pseudomonadota bacterium]